MNDLKIKNWNFENGYCERYFPDLNHFIQFIIKNENFPGWIFRGHTHHRYKLQATIYRDRSWEGETNVTKYDEFHHLQKFKRCIRGRVKLSEEEWQDDDEIWAIGQHNGLRTPLLDWTASPFIAAFFAFHENEDNVLDLDDTGHASDAGICLLNARQIKINYFLAFASLLFKKHEKEFGELNYIATSEYFPESLFEKFNELNQLKRFNDEKSNIYKKAEREIDKTHLKIVSPKSGENMRLITQRGLFTKIMNPAPIETLIRDTDAGDNLLIKISMPPLAKKEALMYLDSMNINYLSLFPDLYGASIFCNKKLSSIKRTI